MTPTQLLLCFLALAVGPSLAAVEVGSEKELWDALAQASQPASTVTVWVMNPILFNTTFWTANPITIRGQVTLHSPHRALLQFCDEQCMRGGTPISPFIDVILGGSLTVSRLFLHKWLPPESNASRAVMAMRGPTPYIHPSGGRVNYVLTVWHVLQHMLWVFDLQRSYWHEAQVDPQHSLFRVKDLGPLDLAEPGLYSAKRIALRGSYVTDSFAVLDISPAGACYENVDLNTTIVYCPYTFADSLKAPYITKALVFHNVGLDRAAYNWLTPYAVPKVISYNPCPSFNVTIGFDQVSKAVLVTGSGIVAFSNMTIGDSPFTPSRDTTWPPNNDLLLGTLSLTGSGRVFVRNCTVLVRNATETLEQLQALPDGKSADPSNPNLRPVFGPTKLVPDTSQVTPEFYISRWTLVRRQWLLYSIKVPLQELVGADLDSTWNYWDVKVRSRSPQYLAFQSAASQGPIGVVKVATGKQFAEALNNANARYIEIVSDFTVRHEDGFVSGAGALVVPRLVEVRGQHPVRGKRYTINLNNLAGVVRVGLRLAIQGDILLTGLGWDMQPVARGNAEPRFWFLPFFEPYVAASGTEGLVETQNIQLSGEVQPLGRGPQMLTAMGLNTTNSATAMNVFVSLAAPAAPGNTTDLSSLLFGHMAMAAPTGGKFSLINTALSWQERAAGAASSGRGSSGSDTPVAAIAVPVAVGGALLIAAAVAVFVWHGRRKGRTSKSNSCSMATKSAYNAGVEAGKAIANMAIASMTKGSCNTEEDEYGRMGRSSGDPGRVLGNGVKPLSCRTSASSSQDALRARGEPHQRSGGQIVIAMAADGLSHNKSIDAKSAASQVVELNGASFHTSSTPAIPPNSNTSNTIERTKSSLMAAALRTGTSGRDETVTLISVLGEGAFGRVYKANWKGIIVAVKVMVLPALSGQEKREKMAVMEAAISSSLSHPNIVQTYTYSVEPVRSNATGITVQPASFSSTLQLNHAGNSGTIEELEENTSLEVRLVQEFCEAGSLRELLDRKAFTHANGVDLAAVLDTAIDVARAMEHLHAQHIVHSDLKPRNILMKANPTSRRGFIAKVADFGLSLRVSPEETHVSNAFQGTMSHMAPETLMHGRVSKAVDVYAFGITLFELYSGERAFKGVPKVVLGHAITVAGKRPLFPPAAPKDLRDLATRCWAADPAARPTFARVIVELQAIRLHLLGADNEAASIMKPPLATQEPAAAPAVAPVPQPAANKLTGAGNDTFPTPSTSDQQQQQSSCGSAPAQPPGTSVTPASPQDAEAGAPSDPTSATEPQHGMAPQRLPSSVRSTNVTAEQETASQTSAEQSHSSSAHTGGTASVSKGSSSSKAPHAAAPERQDSATGLQQVDEEHPSPSLSLPEPAPSTRPAGSNGHQGVGQQQQEVVSIGVGGAVAATPSYHAFAQQQMQVAANGPAMDNQGAARMDEGDPDKSDERSHYMDDSSSSSFDDVPLQQQVAALYAHQAAARMATPPLPPHSLLHQRVEECSDEGLTTTRLLQKHRAAVTGGHVASEAKLHQQLLADASAFPTGASARDGPKDL